MRHFHCSFLSGLVALTLYLLLAFALPPTLSAPFAITLSGSSCSDSQYYNYLSYKCESCTNYYGAQAETSMLPNAYNCTCREGYAFQLDSTTQTYSCAACAVGSGSTRLREKCLACPNGYDAATKMCLPCATDHFLEEKNVLGEMHASTQCVSCGSHTLGSSSSNRYTCQLCPDARMTRVVAGDGSVSCQCPTNFALYNDRECIFSAPYTQFLSQFGLDASTRINYKNIQERSSTPTREVRSNILVENFFPAAVNCYQVRDQKSCNALANFCVASLYDPSNVACRVYKQLWDAETETLNGYEGWRDNLPWLYYHSPDSNQLDNGAILGATDIATQFSFSDRITFILSVYTVNGTWLGYREMKDEFVICNNDVHTSTQWMLPGHAQRLSCNFNVQSLLNKGWPEFYDLFLLDGTQLYPVPVRIENMGDPERLVRRFALYDNAFSKTSQNAEPSVLRFLSSVHVQIKMGGSQLYPPLVRLTYSERLTGSLESSKFPTFETSDSNTLSTPSFTFTAYYTTNFLSHWIAVLVMSLLFPVGGIAVSVAMIFVRLRGKDSLALSPTFIVDCVGIVFRNISNALCFVLICICMFWYWGFKYGAHEFAPQRNEELAAYIIVLLLAFLTKCVDLGCTLWQQITYDVFFIDWEKSPGRMKTTEIRVEKSSENAQYDKDDSSSRGGRSRSSSKVPPPSNTEEESAPAAPDDASEKTAASSAYDPAVPPVPISIWRSVYIAREWKLLNNTRVVDFDLTFLLMLMIMIGFKLIYLGNAMPGDDNLSRNELSSPVLRFWVTTMFWILLFFIPYLFNRLVYFQFWFDPVKKFIKECSESNISVFVLHKGNYGYYIHGETGTSADTSVKQFHTNLQVPEADKPVEEKKARQLLGLAAPNHHSFEMYLTSGTVRKYTQHKAIPRQVKKNQVSTGEFVRDIRLYNFIMLRGQRAPSAVLSQARKRMNRHLQGLINQVRDSFGEPSANPTNDSIHQTLITDRIGIPPPMRSAKKNFLISDNSFRLCSLLVRGIELKLFTFNVLLFGVVDLVMPASIWSFLVVYIVHKTILGVRSYFERINIVRKAMFDERFLI